MLWVESVLDLDRYILDTNGINRWGIDDLGSEVAKLHSLDIRQLVDGVGSLDDLRVGCHKAVNIGPNLKYLGIQHSGNDRCCVVRTATTKVSGLMAVTIASNKAGNDINRFVVHVLEGFLHQLGGQVGINDMLALLVPCADEVAAIHANTVLKHRSDDMRAQALTIADNGVGCLFAQVVNEVYTVEDTLQLVEELIYIIE